MKIRRGQIEDGLINTIEDSAAKAAAFVLHEADKSNPHEVTPAQIGTYDDGEIDDKIEAIVNQTYGKAYWYGRKFSITPWPVPGGGETWAAGDRNGFDFATNTQWEWNGSQWQEDLTPIDVYNGMTVGISGEFLDIPEAGLPGLARYSSYRSDWDYYPNKYNTMDPLLFEKNPAGQETLKDGSIQMRHLANKFLPVGSYYTQYPIIGESTANMSRI